MENENEQKGPGSSNDTGGKEVPVDYALDEKKMEGIDTTKPPVTATRKEQIFEVAVFCFLLIPGLAVSFITSPSIQGNFSVEAVELILNDIALVTLVSFLLWHNRESLHRLGWTSKGIIREAILGIVLFIPVFYGTALLELGFEKMGLTVPKGHLPSFLSPHTPFQYGLAVVLVIVVAICEETIFRGYLLLRFRSVFHNKVAAVLLAGVVFAIGHGYEGTAGAATVYVMGLILSVVYLWRKSLVAPIVMHFLQDFIGIVVVPILFSQ